MWRFLENKICVETYRRVNKKLNFIQINGFLEDILIFDFNLKIWFFMRNLMH